MTDSNSFTEKTKTSKQAYKSGETIATTLRIPPELRTAWFREVGHRMLQSQVGIGWKQVPSAQQIVVEDLARGLGIELPKEILKKPAHEDSGVIRYMLNLPKKIHEKIHERAEAKMDSFNNVALDLLKSGDYERQQRSIDIDIENDAVRIQVTLPKNIYNHYQAKANVESVTVETYIANLAKEQITENKHSMRM